MWSLWHELRCNALCPTYKHFGISVIDKVNAVLWFIAMLFKVWSGDQHHQDLLRNEDLWNHNI